MEDQTAESVVLVHQGVRSSFAVHRVGRRHFVDGPEGHLALVEQPRFPTHSGEEAAGSLVAPMPGKVVSIRVAPGDTVQRGDVLVVIEAMKMEHSVRSPAAGTVATVHVTDHEQVDNGQVLVVVDQDESPPV